MAPGRTAWHPPFAALIAERAPPGVRVEAEVTLTVEPQRADLLVVHEEGARLDEGTVLRGLWPMLAPHSLFELKSVARPPRDGDLLRLLGYGVQYHTRAIDEIGGADGLALVMITAATTKALHRDCGRLGWNVEKLGGGYYQLAEAPYRCFLVLIDEVAASERDPLLAVFGGRTIERQDPEVVRWLMSHLDELRKGADMTELEGYDDLARQIREKFGDELLLRDMPPERRTVGLRPDQTVLALADEILRQLPDDLIDSLPEETRLEVRRRIAAIDDH